MRLSLDQPFSPLWSVFMLETHSQFNATDRFWRIFWIDATSSQTIELSLRDIADDSEAQTSRIVSVQSQSSATAQSVLRWLSRIEVAHDWLLIFDNADHADPGMIAKYIPTGNSGNILFTSRNPGMGGSGTITRETSICVDSMGEEDAILLLLKSAWLDSENEDEDGSSLEQRRTAAAPIVEALCFLPLAIDQAGAAIRSGICTSLSDYLKMYSEHRQRLMSNSPHYEGASNYGRAVYATWDVSFYAIEAKISGNDSVAAEAAESAIGILRTFAFFHHDNILEEIIKRAAERHRKPPPPLDEDPSSNQLHASYDLIHRYLQRQKDGSWDPLFFREGIRMLLSFSLIKRSRTRAGNIYSIHPLVHLWSQDRMSQEERQGSCLAANLLLSLSINFQTGVEDYVFRRALVPHIKSNDSPSREGIFMPYDDDRHAGFALALNESGYWTEAESLLVQVVESRISAFGPRHPATLASMGHLASTYLKQGRWEEAEKLEGLVTETRTRVLGAEHPDTLSGLGNLAVTYGDQGRWKEAEEIMLRVVDMMSASQALGPEHPGTLVNKSNVATMYRNQGRFEEAEMIQLHVTETSRRVLGADHPATLVYMGNLAQTWKCQGRDEDAIALMQKVVDLLIEKRGSNHPRTVDSIATLNQWRGLG